MVVRSQLEEYNIAVAAWRATNPEYYAPHCDSNVLHEPGSCVYCDKHADTLQKYRKEFGINFTGVHNSDKVMCPSECRRPVDTINRWHGNIPMTEEQLKRDEEEWKKVWAEIRPKPLPLRNIREG
jgi:hypothetical protein